MLKLSPFAKLSQLWKRKILSLRIKDNILGLKCEIFWCINPYRSFLEFDPYIYKHRFVTPFSCFFISSRRFSFSPDGFLLSAVFGSPRSVFVLPGWILFSYNDLFAMDNFCSSRIHLVLSGWGWVLFCPDEFCFHRVIFVLTGWVFFSMDKFCSSRMSFVVTG